MPRAEQDAWVGRVLGINPDDILSAPNPALPDPVELTARIGNLSSRAVAQGLLDPLRAGLGTAATAIKAAPGTVAKQLDALEAELARLVGERRAKQAAAEIGKGGASDKVKVVAFAKMRLKLHAIESAIELASGNLQAACEAMLESELFEDDDMKNSPEVQAALANIGNTVPPFADCALAVQDALDTMVNATGEQRAKLAVAALKPIGAYRLKLSAATFLADMESNEGGQFAIVKPILQAVNDLEAALQG